MRTALLLAIIGLLLLFVWERVDTVRVGYQIERLKAQEASLRREHDELRVKLSALAAPRRIAKAAIEHLDMIRPQQGQVIYVRVPVRTPPHALPASADVKIAKNELRGAGP
ncbi:MAG: cell division protein FtsL [Nitrospiraceae bacterium]